MKSGQELINDLFSMSEEISAVLKQTQKAGVDFAEAERDYKMELSKTTLLLKDEKLPATLIQLVIYGKKDVAEARLRRDCKEVIYQAARDRLWVMKNQMDILREQIKREWGDNGQV